MGEVAKPHIRTGPIAALEELAFGAMMYGLIEQEVEFEDPAEQEVDT